jgi:hypothetical protein
MRPGRVGEGGALYRRGGQLEALPVVNVVFVSSRQMLRHLIREVRFMAKTLDDVLAEIREARTVQEGLRIAFDEVKVKLDEATSAEGQAATQAKIDEAISLLDQMQAEGAAAVTENTPAEGLEGEQTEEQQTA